jgi:hypothetical protein
MGATRLLWRDTKELDGRARKEKKTSFLTSVFVFLASVKNAMM